MGVINQTKPYGPYGNNTIWKRYPKWAQYLDLFSKIWTNFNNLEQNLKIPMSNLCINDSSLTLNYPVYSSWMFQMAILDNFLIIFSI